MVEERKRTVSRHALVRSELSDEGMELLIVEDNSEREVQSDDSEHGELANVDQPLSFWPYTYYSTAHFRLTYYSIAHFRLT